VSGRTPHALAERFVQGPITPTLARFAWPLLLTNLSHALAGTWGALWAGQVLGPNALTAVATGSVLLYMVMGTAQGIGTAAGVAIGQSLGAGDARAVKRVVGSAVGVVLVVSVSLAAVGWWLSPRIVEGLGTPAPARDFAVTHLRFTCLTMPSHFTYMVMVMLLRGSGDAHTPMRFTLLWIGLGLLLAPALLAGWGPLPALGIAGLGLGALMSSSIALGGLVAFIYWRRSPIALHGADLRHFRPDPVLWRLLLRRGVPQALESVVVQGAYFTVLAMVNRYGADTAAAYAAAAQLWVYVQLPSNAVAMAMSPMAAMNIGAGRWDRVALIARRGCVLAAGLALLAMVGVYALGERPLRLFVPQGGPVLEQAWQINLHVLWGWVALAVSMGLFAIMRANGVMLAPMLIFAAAMWGIRVPFAAALEPWLGASAIWWSFPASAIGAAGVAWAWYRRGSWRRQGLLIGGEDSRADEGRLGE
jgi:putative MATE family efflux protein